MNYRLEIVDDKGGVFPVIGGSELREIAEEWASETFEPQGRRLVVRGFGDAAHRPPILIALDRETVKGLMLEEI